MKEIIVKVFMFIGKYYSKEKAHKSDIPKRQSYLL